MSKLRVACLLLLFFGVASSGQEPKPPEDGSRRSGLAGTVDTPVQQRQEAPAEGGPTPETPKEPDLRSLVGQLMLVTLHGVYGPNTDDGRVLKDCSPGGVVIPAIVKPEHAVNYIATLRGLPTETRQGIPLLIGANIYSLVQRERAAPSIFIQLPSLLSVAATGDSGTAKQVAGMLSQYLSVMGFNMNLGPTLELAPDLPGAEGSVDCLGGDPRFTAEAGCAMIETFAENKILCMPMGFPGGGSNRQGMSPATLLTPGARLDDVDLLPYRQAIEKGVPLIHVGNTLVPTLDPKSRPASQSAAVMRDLLRGRLKYQGVIVAGPLDDPDIARNLDPAKAALIALESGADMLYWEKGGEHVAIAIEAILAAIRAGMLPREIVEAAVMRILALKQDHELRGRPLPTQGQTKRLAAKGQYPKETYAVERRAITLLRNRGNLLPFTKERSMPIGVTGVVGVDTLQLALEKHIKPIAMQSILTAKHIGEIEDFEIDRITRHIQGGGNIVCVFPDAPRPLGQVRLVHALKGAGMNVVVVLLGYPSSVPQFGEADAILTVYCDAGSVNESMTAVAEALVGRGAVAVLPAVRPLETVVGRAEPFDALDVIRSPAGRLPVTIGDPFVAGFAISCPASGAVKKALWDFGDGQGAKDVRIDHAYAAPGRYPVTLTITDQTGETSSGTFNVVVKQP